MKLGELHGPASRDELTVRELENLRRGLRHLSTWCSLGSLDLDLLRVAAVHAGETGVSLLFRRLHLLMLLGHLHCLLDLGSKRFTVIACNLLEPGRVLSQAFDALVLMLVRKAIRRSN